MKCEACEKCGLHTNCQTPRIKGRGTKSPALLVVGDSPGWGEDKTGKAWEGHNRKAMEKFFKALNVNLDHVRYTYAVRCKVPTKEASVKQINFCKEHIHNEIEKTRPKVVVLLGNVPLKAVLDKTGISSVRGVVYEQTTKGGHTYRAIPTYSPSILSHRPGMFDVIVADLKRASDIVSGAIPTRDPVKYTVVNDSKTLKKVHTLVNALEGVVALDIEATDVNPFTKSLRVLTVAFSAEKGVSYCIPIAHFQSRLTSKEDKRMVVDIVRHLTTSKKIKLLTHNGIYDNSCITAFFGWRVTNWVHDTLAAHVTLDENASHGLKPLTSIYIPEWAGYDQEQDEALRAVGGDWAAIPLDVLGWYNCADSDMTRRLYKIFRRELKKDDGLTADYGLRMSGLNSLMRIGLTGARIDVDLCRQQEDKYRRRLVSLTQELHDYPEIKATVQYFAEKAQANDKRKKTYPLEAYKKPFNPNATNQKSYLLFNQLGLKPLKQTDKGNDSVDADVLESYKHSRKAGKIIELLLEYASVAKVYGTYIKPVETKWLNTFDGRVHSTYKMETVTGRTSSSGPNLQNIPRPDTSPDIRNMFIADKGHILLELDFSQLELRIGGGCYAKDPVFIDAFRTGKDVHKLLASKFYGIPEDQITKVQRTNAKRVNFGVFYGMGADKLSSELGIPRSEAQGLIDMFFKIFKVTKTWMNDMRAFCYKHLYVQSLLGRRRRLPEIRSHEKGAQLEAERQAVNSPIQGLGSDMMMRALARIYDYIDRAGLDTRVKILLTVHDSILVSVERQLAPTVAPKLKELMENVDGLDWVNVPIVADLKHGDRWGSLIENMDICVNTKTSKHDKRVNEKQAKPIKAKTKR